MRPPAAIRSRHRTDDGKDDETVSKFSGDKAGKEVIEAMRGPTGNLRAPTIHKGKTVLAGFDEEVFERISG